MTTRPSGPVADYIEQVADDKKAAFRKLREVVRSHTPDGFHEEISYGMIGYVVPHETYPAGYHCNPKLPLPFASIAAQKSFIALYHMGIYADPELLDWFQQEYPKFSERKLDMGKSCIRFKNPEHIPYELIGVLMEKISVQQWIDRYENAIKR